MPSHRGGGRKSGAFGAGTGHGDELNHVHIRFIFKDIGMPSSPPIHRPLGWKSRVAWEHGAGRESSSARGYGREWGRLRAEVLSSEPFCRECSKRGLRVVATHVDHIRPKAVCGGDERSNLQPLCAACHGIKSALEGVSARLR